MASLIYHANCRSLANRPGAKHFRAGGPPDIHSVLLVVEGGPVTLDVVGQAIEKNTPVVVVEGSGRAADILAYAWRMLHCEKYNTFVLVSL